MWKAQAGRDIKSTGDATVNEDDDWETDPNFVNDVTEEEQRWGSKTIEGSGRTAAALNMSELRVKVATDDAEVKKKVYDEGSKGSFGYGGKFGVEQDRMDKSALGHDHLEKVEKHASQKDYVSGFGGKYGVQADRVDKSAVGWDYQHKLEKHESQKDYAVGFGGKYGVQADRQDKSAVGWGHHEQLSKHESQLDYSKGFGGKFGVETDKQDKSAVNWDHHEKLSKHESQTDYSKGFGGKFGVETDKQDSSAKGWNEKTQVEMHPSQTDMKIGFGGKFGVQTDRVDKSAHNYRDDDEDDDEKETSESKMVQKPNVPTGGAKTSSLKAMFENKAKEEKPVQLEPKKTKAPPKVLSKFPPIVANPPVEQPVSVKETVVPSKPIRQSSPSPKPADVEITEDQEEHHQEPEYSSSPEPIKETKKFDSSPEPVKETKFQSLSEPVEEDEFVDPEPEAEQEESHGKTDYTAVALYDYEAAAEDELTFDPGEIITNIEMVDEGWWRGECRGNVGLFPANYVELQ